jgi:response regulator RpfG family c-di-GMP phosphodiesterase
MDQFVPNTKVLYVDDETHILSSFTSLMRREGYQIHTLSESSMIGATLEKDGPFALVISDQRMPGLDGVGVLAVVKETHPETMRVLLTGFASQDDTQRAINESGIARYMNKPWDDGALKLLVAECVGQYNMSSENKYLVGQIALQNVRLAEMLEGTVGQSIRLLSNFLLYINPQAANQTERIRKLGNAIMNMLPPLSTDERWDVERGFDLFNIGIAMLPPLIQVSLNKDGLQAMERFPVACNHHLVAADLIKDIPRFEKVAAIIRYQKKNYDGSGRPENDIVKGTDIPMGARLLHM